MEREGGSSDVRWKTVQQTSGAAATGYVNVTTVAVNLVESVNSSM